MGRIITAIFMLFALGCAPTVYIHTDAPDQAQTIRDASRLLHVRMRVTDNPQGAISVDFRPHEGRVCGQALERLVGADSVREALTGGIVDCEPQAWSCDTGTFLAHEVGHVLGLNHKDGTLMDPEPKAGAELTKRQRLTVQASAVLMGEVCRQPTSIPGEK